jgi:hypothetical protein
MICEPHARGVHSRETVRGCREGIVPAAAEMLLRQPGVLSGSDDQPSTVESTGSTHQTNTPGWRNWQTHRT